MKTIWMPPKRRLGRGPGPEELFDAIQKIGPDHRDFVDDDDIQAPVEVALGPLGLGFGQGLMIPGHVGLEAAKGVDGLAADVQRGHAGRGQDGHPLAGDGAEVVEEGGFAGAGPPGDEDGLGRRLEKAKARANSGLISNPEPVRGSGEIRPFPDGSTFAGAPSGESSLFSPKSCAEPLIGHGEGGL